MPNYQNPFVGGMPQMGQQRPQGPPQGGPQGMPPMGGGGGMPPPGGGGGMPPMGGGGGMPPPGPAGGQAGGPAPPDWGEMPRFGQARSPYGNSGVPSQLTQAVDHYQQQLMAAQIQGAPPQVIASLQAALQGAQRAIQEWGIGEMNSRSQNRPPGAVPVGSSNTKTGGGRIGGGLPRGESGVDRFQSNYDSQTQMLMQLLGLYGGGMGGGGAGGGGIGY